ERRGALIPCSSSTCITCETPGQSTRLSASSPVWLCKQSGGWSCSSAILGAGAKRCAVLEFLRRRRHVRWLARAVLEPYASPEGGLRADARRASGLTMGLFDTVTCEYPLPDPSHQHSEFQTKDLECLLDHYTITRDGRLVRHRREGRRASLD